MKTINEVIEIMREGSYGIGVTNEYEIREAINILIDNGFKENDYLKFNSDKPLKRITTGDKQDCVIELFTDLTGKIVYVYTNKEDFDSDGESIEGEGILFSAIDFSNVKPKDLLRNFDVIGFKDEGLMEGIYYNGLLYTPYLSMNIFDDNLMDKSVGCPIVIDKIVRNNKTVWQREINIEDLEIGTKVEVEVKGMNNPVHGVIIRSDCELMILFDNYTTTKGWEKGDYKIVKTL